MRSALIAVLTAAAAAGILVAAVATALVRRVKEAAGSMEEGRGELASALKAMNAELQRATEGMERLRARSSRADRGREV
ncbi:MAG: hypothetical protein HY775_09060 [Acidobacteria bacterium]|nr:hypothetical protein [Acidobacteriota bacterium]